MYKIVIKTNYYGEKYHALIIDNIFIQKCDPKNIEKLTSRGIGFNDSEKIKNFLKYNNL